MKILIEIDTDTQRVVPAIPTDEIYTSACDALGIGDDACGASG